MSHGRRGRPFDSRSGALEVAVGLEEGLLGDVLGVVVVPDAVVGVRVDVAQVVAVETLEGAVEVGLRLSVVASRGLIRVGHISSVPDHAAPSLARSACLTLDIHSPGEISPEIRAASPSSADELMPALRTASAIRGTESSASEAWPMIPGICSAGVPWPSSSPARRLRLPSARIVAVRSPIPAMPAKVSCSRASGSGVGDALAPDLGGRDPGGVHAVDLRRGPGEGRRVLRCAGDLHADHVVRALADETGLVEDAAELVAEVRIAAAEHQGRGPGDRLLGVRGTAEGGDGAGADPLGHVLGGECRHRRDQALAEQQDRGPLAEAIADRAHRVWQRRRRHGQADEVDAGQLDVRGALHRRAPRGAGRPAGSARWFGSPSSPPPAPACGSQAGPRAPRARAARRPRSPSCPRRSRPPSAAAAGRRATPTAAR